MMPDVHPYEVGIRRALELEGGLYTFEDVLHNIRHGDMQSFTEGESLLVTRISQFPRKKALELVLMVGRADELLVLEPQLIDFALNHGCDVMLGYGRLGWENFMTDGWRKVYSFYIKDVSK